MVKSAEFQNPITWAKIDPAAFDGVVLVGGHSPGMKQYLESGTLQQHLVQFWRMQRPVGAICHGAARTGCRCWRC
jgi:putative intracellular protease/amidase